MSQILAEVLVRADCGHPAWVPVRDCSHRHNAERILRARALPCPSCQERATRRWRLPDRIRRLRAAAAEADRHTLPDLPRGRVELVPVEEGGWQATLATGESAISPSPTGALLAAFAARLEAELRVEG